MKNPTIGAGMAQTSDMKKLGKTEYLMIALSLVILAVLCAFKVFDSPKYKGLEPVSAKITKELTSVREGAVNINTASPEELATLKEIGEKRAKAIIDYREANGPFKTIDELAEVDDIGEIILELNRDNITV